LDYGQAAFSHPIIKHTIDRVRKGQAEGTLIKSSLSTLSFLVPSNQSHSQLPLLTLSGKWLILFACFHPAFSAACLLEGEVKSKTVAKKKIRSSLSRVYLGRPSSGLTRWVDWVSPGQIPSCFLLRPGPVLGPGRPGPGLTHRVGPGFKTMLLGIVFEPDPVQGSSSGF
jgi:hypothetical protein